ncbi:AttH component of AttEFGH ABC transport system [hydrothermal vent metagenome]|uniref:AttH component of AttEFGH ABC transport system n=1 Tax=hydrothermal vent metagenome TaxID=652676 RepID=A0A3B0ZCS7_9ZZZZ
MNNVKNHAVVLALLVGGLFVFIGTLIFLPHAKINDTQSTFLQQLSSTSDQPFDKVTQIKSFNFPLDHGPHNTYQTEWWYLTGNLQALNGHQFGYQLTFFRAALSPEETSRSSAWASNQIYMGHLALSDIKNDKHYVSERFSRAALGLSGAEASPFRVWLEDWEISGNKNTPFPMTLNAKTAEFGIQLKLDNLKPLILQGNQGLSQKSAEKGNASYYYTYSRIKSEGSITTADKTHQVSGLSWMDREWSTSALAADQAGWDWFALHLSNGYDLMYYQLRKKDGAVDSASAGVLIDPDGKHIKLTSSDVRLSAKKYWQSKDTAVRYPIDWQLDIPKEDIRLRVKAKQASQEMNVSVRYWEGAVQVNGKYKGENVDGSGYLELAGYQK